MNLSILVTGATGTVGSEVVCALQALGIRPIAAVRDEAKARRELGDDLEYRVFDFARPETFADAFENIDSLFLMRPPDVSDARVLQPALDEMKRASVRHIAFLSLLGVEKNRFMPHAKIEDAILKSGIGCTFLRASFFYQNLSTTHRDDIKLRHEIFVPAGSGKTSFIDARDIGSIAALQLRDKTDGVFPLDLTGNEALDYYQVAKVFSDVLGFRVCYTRPSLLRFIIISRRRGVPLGFVLVLCAIYSVARFGHADRVSNDVENILGRAPLSARQFVADYQNVWRD